MHPLIPPLQTIVGANHVLTPNQTDLTAWEQDWRGRARGKALAVVRPGSTAQVAAVVHACAEHATAIVPQGGNTGLVMGSVPDASSTQIVLSLQRMQAIRHVDTANLTMTVEAGCLLQEVQNAAAAVGLLFPLSLASEGSCTIGGNLATNAGGTQVLRYGNARDVCLGLEVVTPQGDVWHGLSGLRKDNTGYDLRHVFIGSEGTLGIITAATLKLYPRPAAQMTAWASVPSLDAAVALLGLAQRQLGANLTGFEVMNQQALRLVALHFPQLRIPLSNTNGALPSQAPSPLHLARYDVLLENSDSQSETHAREQLEKLLADALEQNTIADAVVAENLAQTANLWHVRESIPLAQAQEGLNIKNDISLPISSIAAFCDAMGAQIEQVAPGARLVTFGHLGDGNLHYNVQAPEGASASDFLRHEEHRIQALVCDTVVRFGGSISAEHGIGSLKAAQLRQYKDPVALQMMQALKKAWDPDNRMNPGCVIDFV